MAFALPTCKFGKSCYRLNENHLKHHRHIHLEAVLDEYMQDPMVRLDPKHFEPAMDKTYRMQLDVLKTIRLRRDLSSSLSVDDIRASLAKIASALDQFDSSSFQRTQPSKTSPSESLAEVSSDHIKCVHSESEGCLQTEASEPCKAIVTVTLPTCGHRVQKPCHQPIADVRCTQKCVSLMKCGLHPCASKCGATHSHDNCKEEVRFCFQACGHPSSYTKICSEPIKKHCDKLGLAKCSFGHVYAKKCTDDPNDKHCMFKPCPKQRRQCGHPCTNCCGEDCDIGICASCIKMLEQNLSMFMEQAGKHQGRLEVVKDKKEKNSFERRQILNCGDTKAEYLNVEDQVSKSIQPMHNWYPVVTKIEKVTNYKLEADFEEAKCEAFGDFVSLKFHGTTDDGIIGICKDGFCLPGPPKPGQKPGMFGQGIYFAPDSSKSAQTVYTKGSSKLLLCRILLGRSMEVRKVDHSLNLQKLRSANFDSVFAPRGSGVLNDEFVIFDPRQALPQYIIHYTSSSQLPSVLKYHSNQAFEKVKLTPSRNFDASDPKDNFCRIACGHFALMNGKYQAVHNRGLKEIKYVELIVNKTLEAAFDAKKADFERRGIPSHEVLAFHGTSQANIESILKVNLDPSRTPSHGRAHGNGCYFSEFPDISQGYGDGLLLFRVLPGKEYSGSNRVIPSGYQSIKVQSDTKGFGQMLIITDSAQFVPYFVYHFN